jgi:hypothetical protein
MPEWHDGFNSARGGQYAGTGGQYRPEFAV